MKKKYIVRTVIKDNSLNEAKATIVFVADGKTIYIDNILYNFNHIFPSSFFTVQTVASINSPNILPFTTTEQLLSGLKTTQVRKSVVIDPFFSILPPFTEINALIASRNLNSLLQVVQSVKIIDLGCVEKVSYLE